MVHAAFHASGPWVRRDVINNLNIKFLGFITEDPNFCLTNYGEKFRVFGYWLWRRRIQSFVKLFGIKLFDFCASSLSSAPPLYNVSICIFSHAICSHDRVSVETSAQSASWAFNWALYWKRKGVWRVLSRQFIGMQGGWGSTKTPEGAIGWVTSYM